MSGLKARRDTFAEEQEDVIAAILLSKGYSQEHLDTLYPGEKEALLEDDDWIAGPDDEDDDENEDDGTDQLAEGAVC